MEADEEARLQKENEQSVAFDEELEQDESSDWLQGCCWPQWFRHKPIPLLLTARSMPVGGCPRDLFLGNWHGMDCISPAASERALQLLVVASHQVLARCQLTLQNTPRVLRCWLRSWTPAYFPYPFDSPSAKTVKKYSRIWVSGVCYFMRLRLLTSHLRESTVDLCSVEFNNAQTSAMDSVWAVLSKTVEEASDELEAATVSESLVELLFQLFVTFWTERPVDGDVSGTAIARLSGLLGIHPTEHAFMRAYDYTPILSALVWIGRLILLEYALPLRSYDLLPIPWPSREAYPDLGARLCAQIRPKYLHRGSISPMGYLIKRLQHGRAIAKREGPQTTISWSLDGQTLKIGQSEITLPQL